MAETLRTCVIGTTVIVASITFVILILTIVLKTPEKYNHNTSENRPLAFISKFFEKHVQIEFSNTSATDINALDGVSLESFSRTVILLHKDTSDDQSIFIRGGKKIDSEKDCHKASTQKSDKCSIRLVTNPASETFQFAAYNSWRMGDLYLDWLGAEEGQNTYNEKSSLGTPLVWTTNSQEHNGYQDVNRFGVNFWMLDAKMNCNELDDGWFEFRGLLDYNSTHFVFEENISQTSCASDVGRIEAPFKSVQHVAKCGFINVFYWSKDFCALVPLDKM